MENPTTYTTQLLVGLSLAMSMSCSMPKSTKEDTPYFEVSRASYQDKMEGFWLGQCIANWTGLVTEMDKIGDIGEIKTGDFYTRENWGKPDEPNIWEEGVASDLSPTIDFVLRLEGEVWGADDDTDIEYLYQYLLNKHQTTSLTPTQIRNGWLEHIKKEEENYLWVSNQKAFDLMQEGILPPETSNPEKNEHFEMIDAQLTTEIFGLFAPGRPANARRMARLPIQTTARENAQWISEFYVTMYSLAAMVDVKQPIGEQLISNALQAKIIFPDNSYSRKMFDYVYGLYLSGIPWEATRDSIYYRYQVNQLDEYKITDQQLYCNGCFAAGINFAASLVSLFYGEGDFKETIKIGTLAGWDSDNPTATWGGMLGFILGRREIEKIFRKKFSSQFNIHRTRQNFSNDGIDSFENMARTGISIVNRMVEKELGGVIDVKTDSWQIPIE